MKLILILLFAFFPALALSQGKVLQVKGQNFLYQSDFYKAGESLTILGPDGQPKGTARVRQVGRTQSVAEMISGTVTVGDQIGVGDQPGLPTPQQTPTRRSSAPPQKTFQFSVGMGYPLLVSGKFSGNLNDSTQDLSFSGEGRTGSSLTLTGDFRYWLSESYGIISGFDYVLDRKVDAGLRYLLEGTATTFSLADQYSSMIIHVSFAFRWAAVYLPVGLTYHIPTYTTTGTGSVSGGLGYQIGIGSEFASQFAIEMLYRVNPLKTNITYPNQDTITFSSGTVSELSILGRWLF